ncbi:uncharacterized protein EV420DRAFT_1523923 [Desarmillaria tabescens]|uniref:Peptidase C14 caspase domain-containing protein n=1 Tax=Armillaria tabescens TaxID=1929756 RepID=A0AA39TSG4_ARMTA|nr:uncharacterized protein EV420DRAFT_1523923 [Desarmillaria tabescens]KAK0462284.1 hypothetical protein EV420DRAFT_1523923 [Desarmillaria tabescens]
MEKYFMGDLQVPRDRIQCLLGSWKHTSLEDSSYPSCTHIIDALLGIITNPDVKYGDNIVIFYAGHGSYYSDEKDHHGVSGYIEALCPIDRGSVSAKGALIPDISDRELNTILTQIFRAKGHRITVILDCCHSGSVSRELPELGARVTPVTRGVTLEDMLLVGDSYLRSYPGYRSILSQDWYPDVVSHVLLAVCKEYEFAKEKEVKGEDSTVGYTGIFMDSLVCALRSGYWRKETTYADIPFGLDESRHQTPMVSGKYKDTRLWYQG